MAVIPPKIPDAKVCAAWIIDITGKMTLLLITAWGRVTGSYRKVHHGPRTAFSTAREAGHSRNSGPFGHAFSTDGYHAMSGVAAMLWKRVVSSTRCKKRTARLFSVICIFHREIYLWESGKRFPHSKRFMALSVWKMFKISSAMRASRICRVHSTWLWTRDRLMKWRDTRRKSKLNLNGATRWKIRLLDHGDTARSLYLRKYQTTFLFSSLEFWWFWISDQFMGSSAAFPLV